MGTIAEKLEYLADTKTAIKAALENKGATVGSVPFRQYANIIDTFSFSSAAWYGIEWDILNANGIMKRIGNMNYHASLPVQSLMRGCMLLDDGTVNYYLHPTNWALRADGITAAVHDGSEGQVMVEIPDHWLLFEEDADGYTRRVKLSHTALAGYIFRPRCYVSAYEAALKRDTLTLSSVINTDAKYRGGNNQSAWDGTYRTLLGKPATNISKTNFRTYARNRGSRWNILPDHVYNSIFWLYMVEYANRNSQAPVNAVLDANGCRQGGLGSGVTTADSGSWNSYNGYYPFINCGASNSLGNFSGEVGVAPASYPGGVTFMVPRYRGIENIFGHLWKYLDGIVLNGTSSENQIYTTSDPTYFDDSITGKDYIGLSPRGGTYFTEIIFGTTGCIYPKFGTAVGTALTHWFDYYDTNAGANVRAVLVGGLASDGTHAGLAYAGTGSAASNAFTTVGSRLCFL